MHVLGLAFERLGLFGGTLKREDWQEEEGEEMERKRKRRKRMRERKKKEAGNRKQEARHVLIVPTWNLVGCPLYP